MDRHILVKRLAATGVAVMIFAAACTPTGTSTPIQPVPTDANASPFPTIEATAGDVSTQNTLPTAESTSAAGTQSGTEVGTQAVGTQSGTEVGTQAVGTQSGTAVGTQNATQSGTQAGTALAPTANATSGTADTTQMPAMTPNPNAENQPSALLTSELVGSTVVDMNDDAVGEVQDVLLDDTGTVQYVIVDAQTYLDNRDVDATPEATADVAATESPVDEGIVAIPMADLTVNMQMTANDDDSDVLLYNGDANNLRAMGGFNQDLLDQDRFMIDTTDSQVASDITYDGMIRASQIDNFNLKNAEGDDLGDVQDLIIDVPSGKVKYGVVDFGGFLGIGSQSTAVPWGQFTIDRTSAQPGFRLDATSDTLENAPTIDLGTWPSWPDRVTGQGDWTPNWDNDISTFWSSAASQ